MEIIWYVYIVNQVEQDNNQTVKKGNSKLAKRRTLDRDFGVLGLRLPAGIYVCGINWLFFYYYC